MIFFILTILSGLVFFIAFLILFADNSYIDKLAKIIFRECPIGVIMIICYAVFLVCSGFADKWWTEEYFVPVDAVVTDSQRKVVEEDYGDPDDVKTFVKYDITYRFYYRDKTYSITLEKDELRSVGTIEKIRINSKSPTDSTTPVSNIVGIIIGANGVLLFCFVVVRPIFSKRRKFFKNTL